ANGIDPSQPLSDRGWEDVLAHAGSRSVFGGPTWAEAPDLARLVYRPADPPHAGTGTAETATTTTVTTEVADDLLRSIHPPDGDLRPGLSWLRRRFVQREAADAAELLDRRERTKRALLDLGGIAHRRTCSIAKRLTG